MNRKEIERFIKIGHLPSYVFDVDTFQKRCCEIKDIVGESIGLCYSMKANPFYTENLPECFDRIEVCSPGEMEICKSYHVDPKKIFYSGVNKNIFEVKQAFDYGVENFTVESHKHMDIIDSLVLEYRRKVNVYPRISAETQFGMDLNDILELIQRKRKDQYIKIAGLHFFTGTQKKKTEKTKKEIQYLAEVLKRISSECFFEVENVEYGTGLKIDYFDEPINTYDDLLEIKGTLSELAQMTKLTIEMGRYFAATSGYYYTRVDDVKRNGNENYIIVNGGMNQIIYDGQLKAMRIPDVYQIRGDRIIDQSANGLQPYTVCGSLCTSNDTLVRNLMLDSVKIGDTLVFKNVGAYSFMEGMSVFLSREMPQVWALKNGKFNLLRDFIYTHKFNMSKNLSL